MAQKPEVSQLEGVKHDTGKLRFDLLPLDALREVVKVLMFGANKYGDRNWESGIIASRLWAAAMRHLVAWWEGENYDAESGLSHLAHACCCTLFLLALKVRGVHDVDDRP